MKIEPWILPEPVITPDALLEHSISLKELYHMSGAHRDIPQDDGTTKRELIKPYDSSLSDFSRQAEKHAVLLEASDNPIRHTFGTFITQKAQGIIERRRVKVPKGATIYSTHPDSPAKGKHCLRTYAVNPHRSSNGFYDESRNSVGSSRISWAGKGGYWNWILLDNEPKFWEINT